MKPLTLAFLLLVCSVRADACVVFRGFNIHYLENAQMVFKGEVIDYEPPPGAGGIHQKAYITFKVLETLWGPAQETWRLSWRNSTFGLPRDWAREPKVVLVAATTTFTEIDKTEPRVLQEPCNMPFMHKDSEEYRRDLQRELERLRTRR